MVFFRPSAGFYHHNPTASKIRMKLSTKGMIEIMSHEGICLQPYLDSVGVWTIGIGQTKSDDIDPRTMGKITLQQAIDLFKRKIVQYTNAVDALELNLNQHQYDALTSLCYNFGPGNLRKLCGGRSLPEIGDAIMLYTKPPEIAERRRKEQRLFKFGTYSNADGKILVFPVVNNHPRYRDGYKVDVRPYFNPVMATPKEATAVVVGTGGATAAAASAGLNWPEIVLAAFIVGGIVAAVVIIYRKMRRS